MSATVVDRPGREALEEVNVLPALREDACARKNAGKLVGAGAFPEEAGEQHGDGQAGRGRGTEHAPLQHGPYPEVPGG
jgi:hypothetical protein